MEQQIPVSFGPVDRAQLPATLNKWYDVLPFLESQFSKPVAQRLYESQSSNSVDLNIVQQMCVDHALHGLTFLNEEVACVCGEALAQAGVTLDMLFDVILNGTSALSAGWKLAPDARALLTDSTHPIDRERKAVDNLPGFLRLLRRAVREAITQERCLLFVAPRS